MDAQRLERESHIWMTLNHCNIAPLLGVVISDELGLISPWYRNGNVRDYIYQHPEADRIKLVSDVACGLAYLHNRTPSVVHGDLKNDNVLITETGCAVIIDFGLSSIIEDDPTLNASFGTASVQGAGNTRWMAPELLMEEDATRSPSTDVYSFGCVALYIYTEEIPFKDISDHKIPFTMSRGRKPLKERDDYHRLSASSIEWLYDILVSCWDLKPSLRPSMATIEKEIKRHVPKRTSQEIIQYQQIYSTPAFFE
ncbi:hypothetical protein M407DRAFT_86518 [Tulasnella calospora MUT 4182]|uniref:Protein kinase domain-containing protein n=1 Tax=Tulasnella calospora MUT 4182 TaxID=1051891 RepID=A0A0C3K3L7_9AGAM|nr:hypothetical protein M407DRAFT_86518 [Tulasnella calospora MUT 4182]